MFKDTLYMGLTTSVRILTGAVLFVLLARNWGVDLFGMFMFWYTVANLIAMVVEYGFSQQILKEVGQAPENVVEIMNRFVGAKIFTAVGTLILCFVVSPYVINFDVNLEMFWTLTLAAIIFSFADFFGASFRALGLFHEETRIAIVTNILLFGVISFLSVNGYSPVDVAIGFLFIRSIQLCVVALRYANIVGKIRPIVQTKSVASTLRRGWMYGADTGFTNLYSNVDTVLVKLFLNDTAVGIYQAGIRLVQGVLMLLPVLGSVYLPRLAHNVENIPVFSRITNQLLLKLIVSGVVFSGLFIFLGDEIVKLVYGARYSELTNLMPLFGVFLFLRFIGAGYGVLFTASGMQKQRTLAIALASAVLLILSYFTIEAYQLLGLVFALVLSALFLLMCFVLLNTKNEVPIGKITTRILIAIAVFVGAVVTVRQI